MEREEKDKQYIFTLENVGEDNLCINLYNTVIITMKVLSLMN